MASPLALGTASAATQTVTGITVTSTNNNAAAGGTATVSGTYTATSGTAAPANIDYTVTSGGDTSADSGTKGTACVATIDTPTPSPSGTFTCSVASTHGATTDTVLVFEDNGSGDYTGVGDTAAAPTTVIFSGPATAVHFTTAPTTDTTGTCAQYVANVYSGGTTPAAGQTATLTVSETTATNPGATPISLYPADCSGSGTAGGSVSGAYTISYTHNFTVASNGTVAFGLSSTTAGSGSPALTLAAGSGSDAANVTWIAGGPDSVTAVTPSPTSTTQLTNTTATYTVTATNGTSPVQGVTVNEETNPSASPANADTIPATSCGMTNPSGQVTCSVHNTGTAGTDSLIFWVNYDMLKICTGGNTAGPDSCEPQGTATATFNATPAVDTGHSSLTCVQQLAGADKGLAETNCTLPTSQTSVTFTATVEDSSGNPIANAPVTFTASSAKLGGTTLSGSGLPSGTVNTGANGVATFVVNDPSAANGDNVTLGANVGAISIGSDTVGWVTPHATSLNLSPALQSVTEGGTVTVQATVDDQFGNAVSGSPAITYFVTGRNNAKAGSASSGGTISYTDAGTTPSSKADSILVTDSTDSLTGTATVDYVTGSTTASAVTVDTSGLGVSDVTCAVSGHTAATGVALQGTTEVCALVKNATGEVLAGKTVTFTVSDGQVAAHGGLTTTSGTTYQATTDAAGVALADVTSTKAGTQTVTATADTATGSGTVTYAGPTAAQAYSIAVAPTPVTINPGDTQKFTATVTDKFGNPVSGVVVVYTQSGTGSVTSGGSGSTTITGTDGTASVSVATTATDSGAGSVTFNIGSAVTVPPNACATTGGVCSAVASYTVASTGATHLTLTASTGVKVGGHETIHAVATLANGSPAPDAIVRFYVKGANNTSGSATTDAAGHATYSYLASHHGTDAIGAFVDTNDDQIREANEPIGTATAHIKGVEKPTISLSSSKGKVTIHVTSHPAAKSATVHYFVKRDGSWVKIGTNTTGHLGKAGKTFAESKGKHLTFRAKVMTTPVTTTGTSSAKSITVK